MPRVKNRISHKGRVRQGRGEGSSGSYVGWVQIGDFPSSGRSSRINCLVSNRVADALSGYEKSLRLIFERRQDVTDIRENFPLPLEQTLAIADALDLTHPIESETRKPFTLTFDLLLDIQSTSGIFQRAVDFKLKRDLAKKTVMAAVDIKKAYCRRYGYEYDLHTEYEINREYADNLLLLRNSHRLEDYPDLSISRIEALEPELYREISDEQEPLADTCLRFDFRCGLPVGSSLAAVYYLIWHRYWRVDLRRELRADQSPLRILSRNPFPGLRNGEENHG